MNKTHFVGISLVVLVLAGAFGYMYAVSQKEPAPKSAVPQTTTPVVGGTVPLDTTPKVAAPAATTAPESVGFKPLAKLDDIWKLGSVAVKGTYADADTVKLADGTWRMYYSIQPEVAGNKFEVYSSTSSDGITWKQDAGTRKTAATFPDIVPLKDGTFRMYFQSAGVLKSATSADGLTWKDEAGTRIDKTNDLELTFDNVAAPTVTTLTDGTFVMVYRGTINTPYVGEKVPNQNTQLLLWATSKDGLSWVKKGLAVDTRNTTLYGLGDGPELFDYNDTLTLSFWSYTGVYWSTVDAIAGTFSAPEKVFALAESTAQNKFPANTPGDPVYAKVGSDWFMYFGQKDGIYYATLK